MLGFPTNHPQKKMPRSDRVREKSCRGMITNTGHDLQTTRFLFLCFAFFLCAPAKCEVDYNVEQLGDRLHSTGQNDQTCLTSACSPSGVRGLQTAGVSAETKR